MKNYKIRVLALAIFSVFLSMVTSSTVFAADKPDYKLAISPSIDNLETIRPGAVLNGKFEVFNEGVKDFSYSVSFAPYSVQGDMYEPNFTGETKFTDLKDWIEVDEQSGDIVAGGKKVVNYTITVPEDFHGGMQSAAILVTMGSTSNQGSNVEAVRQLAYIIYGNVDGEVIETGRVLENKVPGFSFKGDVLGTSVVENTGNVYTKAKYVLQVFPLFSDEEVFTNEEEPAESTIFPETRRYNEVSWEGAPQLGIFKVRQTVKIFDEENVTEKIVFLCPLWFLFIVLLLIFCIIFWIVSRAIRRKRENY